MEASRDIERNGATMKKVMEKKRIRERKIYVGFRRARMDLFTLVCWVNRRCDRDLSYCMDKSCSVGRVFDRRNQMMLGGSND